MTVTPKPDYSPRMVPLILYATTGSKRVGFTEASLGRQCHTSCDSRMAASFDDTWLNCSEESIASPPVVPPALTVSIEVRRPLQPGEDVE